MKTLDYTVLKWADTQLTMKTLDYTALKGAVALTCTCWYNILCCRWTQWEVGRESLCVAGDTFTILCQWYTKETKDKFWPMIWNPSTHLVRDFYITILFIQLKNTTNIMTRTCKTSVIRVDCDLILYFIDLMTVF